MTTIRHGVASGVGSGVASRRPAPNISPAHRCRGRVQGQRHPVGAGSPPARLSEGATVMSGARITPARLRLFPIPRSLAVGGKA
jgi:hypothetical protein